MRPYRHRRARCGHRRTPPRLPHRNLRARLLRPHQPAALRSSPQPPRARKSAPWWMPRMPSTPLSAAAAGVRLDRLLWVRCAHNAEHALKAADLLIQGGGFGLVVMDLGDTPPAIARAASRSLPGSACAAPWKIPPPCCSRSRGSPTPKPAPSLSVECAARARRLVGRAARLAPAARLRGARPSTDRSKQCSPVFTATAI